MPQPQNKQEIVFITRKNVHARCISSACLAFVLLARTPYIQIATNKPGDDQRCDTKRNEKKNILNN